ncbi:hypothetical protein HMPREF1556_00408 [Porphyromonas sp. oral taxon 278 str. W7784]|nr:hypothetical protein HMPREF1556_00408 [Porphyromonas sp. oral taxon 278 str. W7784]
MDEPKGRALGRGASLSPRLPLSLPHPRGQILSAQIRGTSPLSQTGGFYPRKRGS